MFSSQLVVVLADARAEDLRRTGARSPRRTITPQPKLTAAAARRPERGARRRPRPAM
jgi:hypothetical protein